MQLAKDAGLDWSTAASWSTPPCAPAIPTSSHSANAPRPIGQVFGLVAPLYRDGRHCGRAAGRRRGVEVQVERDCDQAQGHRNQPVLGRRFREPRIARRSCCATPRAAVYRRLVLKDNRIIGAVMYGDTSDGAWFFDL